MNSCFCNYSTTPKITVVQIYNIIRFPNFSRRKIKKINGKNIFKKKLFFSSTELFIKFPKKLKKNEKRRLWKDETNVVENTKFKFSSMRINEASTLRKSF